MSVLQRLGSDGSDPDRERQLGGVNGQGPAKGRHRSVPYADTRSQRADGKTEVVEAILARARS